MKYYVCVRIGHDFYEHPSSEAVTFAQLYHSAKSIARYGRRYSFDTSFAVFEYDGHNMGKQLFRICSRKTRYRGYICRHCRTGVYGGVRAYNF